MVDTLPFHLVLHSTAFALAGGSDDTQVEVQGCTGQVAKVPGESDHETFTLCSSYTTVFV